jgi:Ca2+-binding RTX toxin-like protein
LGAGTDTVQASITYTLVANIERLTLTGAAAIDGTGNELDNVIVGNSGVNILRGLAGNDTLNGKAGHDTLDGGGGADDMGGGLGVDLYIVDNVGDVAAESNGDGAVDTVQASVSHTLSANIENLTLTGAAAIDGTGNARANVIVGNGAANNLSGKGGADALTGGGGTDAFSFDTPLVAGVVTTIADMTHGIDRIALGQAVFMEAGPIGRLASKAFYIGAAAHDSSDRIIYNAATGDLIYDPDGGRAQPGAVFANVGPGLALNAGDFRVV